MCFSAKQAIKGNGGGNRRLVDWTAKTDLNAVVGNDSLVDLRLYHLRQLFPVFRNTTAENDPVQVKQVDQVYDGAG